MLLCVKAALCKGFPSEMLSVCLSICCLPVSPSNHPSIHSSIYGSIYSSAISRSIYLCIYLCIYLFIYLSIYLSIYLFRYLSIHPSIHLSLPRPSNHHLLPPFQVLTFFSKQLEGLTCGFSGPWIDFFSLCQLVGCSRAEKNDAWIEGHQGRDGGLI